MKRAIASVLLTLGAGVGLAQAQPAPVTLRIALVPQWNVNQHRVPVFGFHRRLAPQFRAALDGGVVDHVVFFWQKGRLDRRWLVKKPIRVVTGPEAAALGGRGQFDPGAVRLSGGPTAWTEVDVVPRSGTPDDLLVLEVGGDVNVMTQVVATVALAPRDGGIEEVPLSRAIGQAGPPVAIVFPPFGLPLEAKYAPLFRGVLGVDLLVARSPVHVFPDAGVSSNGVADVAIETAGEWQQGDRVLIRIPLATLRSGAPGVVLAWRDRVTKPEAGDSDRPEPPRVFLPAPFAS